MSISIRQRNALTTLALAMIAGAILALPSPAAAHTCANVERGTQAPDRLVGTTGGDRIQAGGGSDEVNGLAGSDCLAGGRESDVLRPGDGVDRVRGGGGRDKLVTRDGSRDIVRCGDGRDKVVADWRDRVKRSCDRVVRRGPKGPTSQGGPPSPAGDCVIDQATMTAPGCRLVSSDSSSKADPKPSWGKIDCEHDSRVSEVASGGDPHLMATGATQGNGASRRLTVFDGDYVWGERCELGENDFRDGPTAFYHEGQHRLTYLSYKLGENYPLSSHSWQVVMQMKQSQPSANGSGTPVLALEARNGRWNLVQSDSAGYSSDTHVLWSTPAETGVWTRFAFDVVYSQDSDRGSIRLSVDLNGDGDSLDPGEQSPAFETYTLKYETEDSTYLDAGDSIPSHLRIGLYHDSDLDCPAPSGCSVQVDNVQVVRP